MQSNPYKKTINLFVLYSGFVYTNMHKRQIGKNYNYNEEFPRSRQLANAKECYGSNSISAVTVIPSPFASLNSAFTWRRNFR